MPQLLWYAAAAAGGALLCVGFPPLIRRVTARRAVLREVVHTLRGGSMDRVPGHGLRARGQLGQLEVTVELHRDPHRRSQSPMWRVLAVGPVRIEHPLEVATGEWQGAIDPGLARLTPEVVPGHSSPALALRAEQPVGVDHPVLAALLRQGSLLTRGALYARPDLMRAEVSVGRNGDQRALFAWLSAMTEISETPSRPRRESGPRSPRAARAYLVRPVGGESPSGTRAAG